MDVNKFLWERDIEVNFAVVSYPFHPAYIQTKRSTMLPICIASKFLMKEATVFSRDTKYASPVVVSA
jgi:hypothetical protein